MADQSNGDSDLNAHLAVCRVSGVALSGPAPAEVIGPVDRHRLLVYLAHELQWGLDHGDQRYAVLNACRAAAYAEIGLLLSKVSGGQWWVEHHGPDAPVEKALQAQLAGHDLGPGDVGTRRFVHHVVHRLATPTSRSVVMGSAVRPCAWRWSGRTAVPAEACDAVVGWLWVVRPWPSAAKAQERMLGEQPERGEVSCLRGGWRAGC